jgi:HEPN domain-containing protein
MRNLEVQHFNEYVEPTLKLVLSLLKDAYKNQHKLDRVLKRLSEDVFKEIKKEIEKLVKDGKLDLNETINLMNNPSTYLALKQIEAKQLERFTEYMWIGY